VPLAVAALSVNVQFPKANSCVKKYPMNYICSWFCADDKGEESNDPQTGRLSSDAEHQLTDWRCVLVFFLSSRRFNRDLPHILFTNTASLPIVDGVDVRVLLEGLQVKIVQTPLRYKTPTGYYRSIRHQFYAFSILEHISAQAYSDDDAFLIVDPDSVFLRSADKLYETAARGGFLSFEDEVEPDYAVNGLSRDSLRAIYRELLGRPVYELPAYHLSGFLLCTAGNVRLIDRDFRALWPVLLKRHELGKPKFNEEAHTLSFLFYRHDWKASPQGMHIKRIWTNPLFYRNVEAGDGELTLWHLPAEKTFGFVRLFRRLIRLPRYGLYTSGDIYRAIIRESMGVPHLSVRMRVTYYIQTYYRAIVGRRRESAFTRFAIE